MGKMTSTGIKENIYQSMKAFAEYAKTSSNAALIVEATIVDIIDEGVGEYSVEYFGNTFSAYSNSRDITYLVGDNVYISVPENDFSKNKIIIGLSNPKNAVFSNNDNKTVFYDISDNLITNDFGIIEMCSYQTTEINDQPISNYIAGNFAQILNKYKTFAFSCEVQTTLETEQQNSGIYGITLKLPLIVNSADGGGATNVVWKEFPLNTTNMMGNFYRYDTWSPQTIYFELDSQYIVSSHYVPTISYYCYDFAQDNTKTTPDIFIKNISLKAVDELSTIDESGYGLTLKASEGPYFGTYYADAKTLTPTVRYNKKEVKLNTNNCEVYWFKEDVDIKSNSEYYSVYGGFGWKCLNPRTNICMNEDGTETFDWITSNLTLVVPRSEVSISARYKCVIIYKQTQISGIITLSDLNTTKDFVLFAKDNNTVLIKDTGYAHLIAKVTYPDITDSEDYRNSFIYSWARYNKNGSYVSDTDGFFEIVRYNEIVDGSYETEVRFPVNAIEDINTIYCSATYVKDNLDKELLGTDSISLSTSILYEYNLTIENDDLIYKYDTNGDSPAGTAYDGPSTSKVTSIAPLNFTIKKASGEELTNEEYCYVRYCWIVPKDSLFVVSNPTRTDDDNYYFEGFDNYNHDAANLVYKIANRYNVTKANSAITLLVNFKNKVLERTVNISFIKEGQNGTNGTAYAARLVSGGLTADTSVPYGTLNAEGYAQKLKFVYNVTTNKLYYYDYEDGTLHDWSVDKKKIFTQVYENSSLLTYGTDYSVQYSMFDERTTIPCFTVNSTPSMDGGALLELSEEPDATKYPCNILQARIIVTAGNSSVANSQEIIYAYYPIELTITNMDSLLTPTIEGGFAEIMYAADGTNPSWDQTAPFTIRENQNVNILDYYDVEWTAQSHITPHTATGNEIAFVPDNKYDDGNSKNYVSARMHFDQSKATVIANEIARLQSENTNFSNARTAITTNQSYLENFGNNYTYNSWFESLDQIKPLLDIQTNMVYNATRVLSSIDELNDYINAQTQYSGKPISVVCANLITEKNALELNTSYAIIRTQRLSGISPYGFEDLISLADNKLSWSEEIKDNYTRELGTNTALNFEVLITNINQAISGYQTYYSQIDTEDNHNRIIVYNNIILDIRRVCDYIQNNAYPRFVSMKTRVLEYLDYFDRVTSFKDLKNIINLMYFDILSTSFELDTNKLIIKDILINELEKLDNYYQAKIAYNNILIQNLGAIALTEGYEIFHIRPIVTYLNRYSMSNINAWDGNKIETGDGSYLLAPQVGAGVKENDNSFTGIVIGQRNLENIVSRASQVDIGLFGYSQGRQSIFLNAKDGSATFGVSGKGQIKIIPSSDTAIIQSGNYDTSAGTGMKIDLTTPEIRFGSGRFYVTSEGNMHAAGGGTIGGWSIGLDKLTGGATTLNSNGTITCSNLIANTAGSIGGWSISSDRLTGGATTLNSNGTITCSNLIANTSGQIGGWNIGANSLSANNITIGSNGSISCAPYWSINSDGSAIFNNISANIGGNIAGWVITPNLLTGGNLKLYASGTIEGPGFVLNNTGLTLTNPNNASSMNWNNKFIVDSNGILHAVGAIFEGNVTASSLKIDNGSGGYIQWYGTNNHPTISGLNVGSGGIKMNTTDGISGCYNLGNGPSVFYFHGGSARITTSAVLEVSGSTALKIGDRTLSQYTNDVVSAALSTYATQAWVSANFEPKSS